MTKFKYLIKNIKDLNEIQVTKDEINKLNKEIKNIKFLTENKKNRVVDILPEFQMALNSYKEIDLSLSKYATQIREIYLNLLENEQKISLEKIKLNYYEKYNKQISIMTISRNLRNKLNIHYVKTKLKNQKLNAKNYQLMSQIFI